jgi:prevent-host-death family protein
VTSWQVQDAKARFSEFLEASIKEGPQVATRRGVEAAVLVPIEELRRLQRASRPSLKQLLLAPEPRFENLVPPRRSALSANARASCTTGRTNFSKTRC